MPCPCGARLAEFAPVRRTVRVLSRVRASCTHDRYYYESAAGEPVAFDTRQFVVDLTKIQLHVEPAMFAVPSNCKHKCERSPRPAPRAVRRGSQQTSAQAATGPHVAGVPCPPSATEPPVRTLTRRQIEAVPPSAVTAVEDGAAHVQAVEAQAVQAAGTSVAGGCVTHTVVGRRGDFKLATLIAFSQFGFQEK